MDLLIETILEFVGSIINAFLSFISGVINYIFYIITTYPLELILLGILIFIVVKLVRDISYRAMMQRKTVDSEIQIRQSLGYIVYIVGKIRVGKTTFMSALAHVLVKVLRYQAQATCEKVKTIILDLDWREVDLLINDLYAKKTPVHEASDIIFKTFPTQLEKIHYSYINRETKYENLMFDYIEARYALLRNNYIYTLKGQEIYCRVTKNYSKVFDPKWTQWKNAWEDRDYQLPRYCIILWDEKNMDPDKKMYKWNQAVKEDDGTPEFLRAFGNSSKETRYLIYTAQEVQNWVANERRLVSSIIEIRGRMKILVWSFYYMIINSRIRIRNFRYSISIFLKFTSIRKDNYINNNNRHRRAKKKLNLRLDYIDYKSFIRFDISIYNNIEDVGKRNTSTSHYSDDLSLYFNLFYAWGNIDTWQLSYMDDALTRRSKYTIFDAIESQPMTEQEKLEATASYLERTLKDDQSDKYRKKNNLPKTKAEKIKAEDLPSGI